MSFVHDPTLAGLRQTAEDCTPGLSAIILRALRDFENAWPSASKLNNWPSGTYRQMQDMYLIGLYTGLILEGSSKSSSEGD